MVGQNTKLLWKQTLTSTSDGVLGLVRIANARLLSDTTHCPMLTSKSVLWQRLIVDRGLKRSGKPICATKPCRSSFPPPLFLTHFQWVFFFSDWQWPYLVLLKPGESVCACTYCVAVTSWGGLTYSVTGVGVACWLERRTRDRKVANSCPGRSGGRIFFSRVHFLCGLLFGVRSSPCYRSCT